MNKKGSLTFHISNGKHAINNKQKLIKQLKHNLRSFDTSNNTYDKEKNVVLIGADNAKDAYKDVEFFYNTFFLETINKYNAKQKRSDRKIYDYFEHINDDNHSDIATEILISFGDKEMWEDIDLKDRYNAVPVLENVMQKFLRDTPNFKPISAVVHMDESIPQIQLIGIPIGTNYKNGMEMRVAKTKVFTVEKMKQLHIDLRKDLAENFTTEFQKNGCDITFELEEKLIGRGFDLSKEDYIEAKEKGMIEKIKTSLKVLTGQKNKELEDLNKIKEDKEKIKNELEILKLETLKQYKPTPLEIENFKYEKLKEINLTDDEIETQKEKLKNEIVLTQIEKQQAKEIKIKEYELSEEDKEKIRNQKKEEVKLTEKEIQEVKKQLENKIKIEITEESRNLENIKNNIKKLESELSEIKCEISYQKEKLINGIKLTEEEIKFYKNQKIKNIKIYNNDAEYLKFRKETFQRLLNEDKKAYYDFMEDKIGNIFKDMYQFVDYNDYLILNGRYGDEEIDAYIDFKEEKEIVNDRNGYINLERNKPDQIMNVIDYITETIRLYFERIKEFNEKDEDYEDYKNNKDNKDYRDYRDYGDY